MFIIVDYTNLQNLHRRMSVPWYRRPGSISLLFSLKLYTIQYNHIYLNFHTCQQLLYIGCLKLKIEEQHGKQSVTGVCVEFRLFAMKY